MGGRNTAEKKQDFGLMQSTMLSVECPLRARSRRCHFFPKSTNRKSAFHYSDIKNLESILQET